MTSIAATIAQATSRLASGPHPERVRLDAETLLLHLLDTNKAWLLAHADEEVAPATAKRYNDRIERRFHGEPIQYIAGVCEFYGLPFRVTTDVLIPRPETEHLVEKAIALAATWNHPHIVDVGTGSGAIAIALAHALPKAQITAVDLSPAALDVARDNAERNHVSTRIRFLPSDLLMGFENHRFDLIVSNPPYVPLGERAALAVEVREHEPAMALFAGEDGLEIYRRLIPAASRVLSSGGSLVVEIGYGQAEVVRHLFELSGFQGIEFTADLQKIPRVASAQYR